MKLSEAEEIAKKKFKEHLIKRPIPEEFFPRLSKSAFLEKDEWIIEISLLPHAPNAEGLETDLFYPPSKLMVTIRVNKKTGDVVLREEPDIVW